MLYGVLIHPLDATIEMCCQKKKNNPTLDRSKTRLPWGQVLTQGCSDAPTPLLRKFDGGGRRVKMLRREY